MAYFKHIPDGDNGKIIYNRSIVNGIVLLAISEIEGVEAAVYGPAKKRGGKKSAKRSVKLTYTKNGIDVDVFVKINQSASVSDMAFKIQENIKHNVEAMTEYRLNKINVRVAGVIFDEEQPANI
ncbi:MAG: hypothetical protein DBX59_09860 [Bacillota bacterium]|nr:MAG: hypothetical protein DBX59_09860 [Bacillota bacterium]